MKRPYAAKFYAPPNQGGGLRLHLWFADWNIMCMDLEIFANRMAGDEGGTVIVYHYEHIPYTKEFVTANQLRNFINQGEIKEKIC